jgi:uncharacterized lipoprotein
METIMRRLVMIVMLLGLLLAGCSRNREKTEEAKEAEIIQKATSLFQVEVKPDTKIPILDGKALFGDGGREELCLGAH